MNATALQVLSMMSAIAYNGVQMRPHLIKEIVDHNGEILYQAQPNRSECSRRANRTYDETLT